jgi:bifunctional enzyme CysN/CysC
VLEQTRRHAVIGSILGVHHFALCVNKMDLVDFSQERFDEVCAEFAEFASKLEVPDITFIPISALGGDNVTQHSPNLDWYGGPTLLHHLEHVYVGADRNLIDPRFPVQYVIRPKMAEHHDYRGYAGTVASGAFRVGDEVLVLPSGLTSTIAAIDGPRGEMQEARPQQSVVLRLTDDLDVSRGDMICRPHNAPDVAQDIDATVCWFSSKPLVEGMELFVKHTTRTVRCRVQSIRYRLEVNDLHRDDTIPELGLNDIGRITLRVTSPLMVDSYRRNRSTGSFVLIDPGTNATVAGGIVLG